MLISDQYKALGGEKFITIGFLRDSSNANYITVSNNSPQDFAYYLFDDVSVVKCNASSMDERYIIHKPKVYPNPTRNNFFIDNGKSADYEIRDLIGRLILKNQLESDNENIDVSNLLDGIYIYNILLNNEYIGTGKLIINSNVGY